MVAILVRRLTELIESSTDPGRAAVEPGAVAEVKRLARTGNSALQSVWDLLLGRMKHPHSQVQSRLGFCEVLHTYLAGPAGLFDTHPRPCLLHTRRPGCAAGCASVAG